MATITLARTNVTVEEVAEALRQGLGSRYQVLAGVAMGHVPFGRVRDAEADTIVVGRGKARIFRAEVTISRQGEQTRLHVHGGGLSALFKLVNLVWIVAKVSRVLRAAPGLR